MSTRRICAITVAVTAMLAATPSRAAAQCANANLVPAAENLAAVNEALRCLVNEYRSRRGLMKLRSNSKLYKAAARHSRDMLNRNFFSHVSPSGTTPSSRIKRTGYYRSRDAFKTGENLGWGTRSMAAPAAVMASWLRSSEHIRNLRNRRFRDIGVAYRVGLPSSLSSGSGAIVTATFGYVRRTRR